MKIVTVTNFMKFDIKMDKPFAGFSMAACKPQQYLWICQKEFVSSEDGDLLISRLENFASILLNKISQVHNTIIVPSSIDNMLVILRGDGSTTIYINVPIKALMRSKKAVEAGQVIYRDDIADIKELVFNDINVPEDVGVVALFSVGWRKGLFYDLVPLPYGTEKRDYDLNQLLGGYYAYLIFQERFKITDSEWKSLFQNGWFPFITLNNDLISGIINHNREGWNVDDLLSQIQENVLKRLPDGLETWAHIKAFEPHMDFIFKAAEHYQKNDAISCISVLFPRIEGIMREYQSIQGQPDKASQKDLAGTVLPVNEDSQKHQYTPLLPLRFHQYLTEVYFANFDPLKKDNTLSRNTVGHGIATKENFDAKGATLGFLILDQLSYYFSEIS